MTSHGKRPVRQECAVHQGGHETARLPFVLIAILAGVALVTLLVQWPALRAGALCFDDAEYLVDNPVVRNPGIAGAWRFLREVFEPSTVHGYYQPLTMISLMLDVAAGGRPDDLLPFHRTSLLLHVANAVLVALFLYQLLRRRELLSNSPTAGYSTFSPMIPGSLLAAGLVGILFGVHPMAVETITWIGERKTALAAFFALISLILYVRYTTVRRAGWLMAGLVSFSLALLAKPTATLLPLCMFILDYWPLGRFKINRQIVLEKVPFLVVAIISAFITYESQRRTAVTVAPGEQSVSRMALVLCHNVVFYLQRAVFPSHPSAHYPYPVPFDLSNLNLLVGVVGTIVLLAVLVVSLRWTRAAAMGWLFFFIAIFPTMGVVGFTNVIAADKYAYLPSLGLMLSLATLLAWLWNRPWAGWPIVRTGAIAAILAATASASVVTRTYLAQWSTTECLFRYMFGLYPEAAAIRLYLAAELARQGRAGEAIEHYRKAILLAPAYEGGYLKLGLLEFERGNIDEAITLYRKALSLKENYPEAHNNLANALLRKGQRDLAIEHYRKALEQRSDFADVHYNLANVLAQQADLKGAIDQYEAALADHPFFAAAHNNLANVLWQEGRFTKAVDHYRQALQYRPNWWQVANNLAWIHATDSHPEIRNPSEAVRLAELAVQLTRKQEHAPLGTLAIAYAESGQQDKAQKTAQEAIALAQSRGQGEWAAQLAARMNQYRRP